MTFKFYAVGDGARAGVADIKARFGNHGPKFEVDYLESGNLGKKTQRPTLYFLRSADASALGVLLDKTANMPFAQRPLIVLMSHNDTPAISGLGARRNQLLRVPLNSNKLLFMLAALQALQLPLLDQQINKLSPAKDALSKEKVKVLEKIRDRLEDRLKAYAASSDQDAQADESLFSDLSECISKVENFESISKHRGVKRALYIIANIFTATLLNLIVSLFYRRRYMDFKVQTSSEVLIERMLNNLDQAKKTVKVNIPRIKGRSEKGSKPEVELPKHQLGKMGVLSANKLSEKTVRSEQDKSADQRGPTTFKTPANAQRRQDKLKTNTTTFKMTDVDALGSATGLEVHGEQPYGLEPHNYKRENRGVQKLTQPADISSNTSVPKREELLLNNGLLSPNQQPKPSSKGGVAPVENQPDVAQSSNKLEPHNELKTMDMPNSMQSASYTGVVSERFSPGVVQQHGGSASSRPPDNEPKKADLKADLSVMLDILSDKSSSSETSPLNQKALSPLNKQQSGALLQDGGHEELPSDVDAKTGLVVAFFHYDEYRDMEPSQEKLEFDTSNDKTVSSPRSGLLKNGPSLFRTQPSSSPKSAAQEQLPVDVDENSGLVKLNFPNYSEF